MSAPPSTPRAAAGSSASEPALGLVVPSPVARRLDVPRLRAIAKLRRRWAKLLLLVPAVFVVVVDFAVRGDRLIHFQPKYIGSYLGSMVESAALWAILLYAASARRGFFRWVAAALFVVLAMFSIGGQIYFHRSYSTYLNLDATLFATSVANSVFGQLKADGKNFLTSVVPPIVMALALIRAGRSWIRPRAGHLATFVRVLVPFAVIAAFLIPCSYRTVQGSTPDVIYCHALGGLMKALSGDRSQAQVRPGLRTPPKMPTPVPAKTPKRNVLLVLTESVRADVACSAYVADCPTTPQTNEAAPARHPLLQMRSNASTTAIELAVLWSGMEPTGTREALHSAPLLFDYANAAGLDTAYWTSHHMMFANSRLYVQDLPTKKQCGATDLDPLADIDIGARDELVAARAEAEIGALREPFFAVAHFGNTHAPYLVDPDDAPFQPSSVSKSPGDNEAYRNHYKNAVHRQDKAIAALIRFVRQSPLGNDTVILFTSDHGEQLREHGQLGHTCSVYEEEVHVPFWIDAPPGTLSAAEEAALAKMRDEPAWHTDVTPTILDLLGLLDAKDYAGFEAPMVGQSLIRPRRAEPQTLALTNCSGLWGCAFRNWGMMRGTMKLEAREWDTAWQCFDVLADPKEEHDLGPAACGDLVERAQQVYGGLPGR